MKEKLAKLINVKTIVTIVLTIVFAILSLRGDITGTEFLVIISTIYGFYFGTQAKKE
jgi:hypothetical protein